MSDATLVTGSSGARAPRRGEVLGERYEIAEALAADALVCTYRAVDQESDATVLLRCTAPGLLGERDARRLVDRAKAIVGGGGRVLSALREIDREGATVFTVEAWPRGTSLRAVLDARRAKGARFEARELLPVIARLAAAIASIPEPYAHGDVRAERVWVDPDGLVLTGSFLVSLLPGDTVVDALRDDEALRRGLAPEVAEGLGGRASDRWGAAAIVWEAMTGRAAPPGTPVAPPSLGAVGAELARLLSPDPAARPASLDGLVARIAELAGMPVPRVEVDPFPVRTIETAPDDATQVAENLAGRTERPPPLFADAPTERSPSPRERAGAPSLDTIETDLEGLGTDPAARPLSGVKTSPDDTAPHRALGADGQTRGDDLDPRLVRAALADDHELDSRELEMIDEKTGKNRVPSDKSDDLDPRLVRAALGIVDEPPKKASPSKPAPKRAAAVTQELDALDLEPLRKPGAKAEPARPAAAKAGPAKVEAKKIAPPAAAIPAPAGRVSAPPAGRKKPVKQPEPVPLPTDIKPIPRPRVTTKDSGEMRGPVLFDASRPTPPGPAPQPPPAGPPAVAVAATPAGPIGPVSAPPRPQPMAYAAPPTHAARSAPARGGAPAWASWVIVVGAIVLGIAIVAGGFWYRAALQREAEQQQFIQQRLRELQQQR